MDTLINKKQQIFRLFGAKIIVLCTLIMISVRACDKVCFDTCILTKDVSICEVECACPQEAQDLTTELQKTQRCFSECRQNCALDMFSSDFGSSKHGVNHADCFGACSCICNKGCTDSCASSPIKGACLQSCGCPNNVNKTEQLLLKSQAYFNLPLDPRSEAEMNAEFQGKLSDMITQKYKDAENKVKFELNTHLGRLERKWNEYVANANKIGVDPVVFCNQTCSHDCFVNSTNSAESILTGCLINQCRCFYPSLPKTTGPVSFEALIALKEMINEEHISNKVNIPSQRASIVSQLGNIIMQQEAAPSTPVAPIAPTPAAEATPTPQTRSDVLTDPAGTVKECNLTCFRECLDLKKYVPFPVIQQCISLRCNCNLDESVEKLTGLIEMNSINTVSSTPLNTGKHSVLGDFFFILLLIALISGVYFYYKNVIQKDEKSRSSVRDKESYYDTGYEQLTEEPLYQHF